MDKKKQKYEFPVVVAIEMKTQGVLADSGTTPPPTDGDARYGEDFA